jgi:DNA-binding CsgD family transcriptional regulator
MFDVLNLEVQNSLGLYIFAKDRNLKYIYCNDVFAEGLGLNSVQEVFGKTDSDLFPKDTARFYQNGDTFVLKGGALINQVEYHPEKSRIVTVTVSKKVLKNRHGSEIGIAGSAIKTPSVGLSLKFENKKYYFQIEGCTEYFTKREFEVFRQLLNGATAKKIAMQSNLSCRTIEFYIQNIRDKMVCQRKTDIRERAIELGMFGDTVYSLNLKSIQ